MAYTVYVYYLTLVAGASVPTVARSTLAGIALPRWSAVGVGVTVIGVAGIPW